MIASWHELGGEGCIKIGELQNNNTIPVWSESEESPISVEIELDKYELAQMIDVLKNRLNQMKQNG